MKKSKILFIFLLIALPLFFTYCKKDKKDDSNNSNNNNNNNNPPPPDPKAALWDKWWYNDTRVDFLIHKKDTTCLYFDSLHLGSWHWIDDTDTMEINGISQPGSWRMFFMDIQDHQVTLTFSTDDYLIPFTYTDQEK